MVNTQRGNSTTNAILIILLVVIVALAVWFVSTRNDDGTPNGGTNTGPGLNIDLRGDGTPEDNGGGLFDDNGGDRGGNSGPQ
jgi:hypothetical protein